MALSTGTKLGPYEILAPSAPEGWERSTGRATPVSGARSRSRSCRRRSRRTPIASSASSRKRAPPRRSTTRTSSRSTRSAPSKGASYIAMELVDGLSLREMLAAGPLPTKKLLDVAVQVAEALAKAHGAGIVHRDLKPENVDRLEGRLRQAPRLRPREDVRRAVGGSVGSADDRPAGDAARHRHGHGRLHVAGAGERPSRRFPLRPVRLRFDPLRDGDGPAGLPEEDRRRNARRDHPRRARARRAGQPADPRAAALDRRALSRQGARRALRFDARPRPRLEERSRAPRRSHDLGLRRNRRRRAGPAQDPRRAAGDRRNSGRRGGGTRFSDAALRRSLSRTSSA